MPEEKNTNPEVPPTTSTGENPRCLCCVPAQPLEPPLAGESLWTCPVEQTKYEYNPADGSVRRVGGGGAPTPGSVPDPKTPVPGGGQPSPEVPEQKTATTTSLFPESPPSRRPRQVNPDKPFSG